MAKYEVRLGAKITLDDATEADLIEIAERLNSSRKMSSFMTALFRMAFDNIKFYANSSKEDVDTIIDIISNSGASKEREEYFNNINNKVREMNSKIDKIYDMAFKVYSLSQVNKMNGLSGKSENVALAQFALQKQMRDIETILGMSIGTYESGKLMDMQRKADELIEFIIDTYEGIGDALGISDKDSDSGEFSARIEELERKVIEKQNTIDEIKTELMSKEVEISKLKAFVVNDNSDEIDTLQKQVRDLKEENTRLKEENSESSSDEIRKLKRELRKAEDELEDIKDENRLLEKKVKRLTASKYDEDDIEIDIDSTSDKKVNEDNDTERNINFLETADIAAISNLFGE